MTKLNEFQEYLQYEFAELALNYCENIEGSPFLAEDINPIEFTTEYFDQYITQFTHEMNKFVVDGDSNNAHDILEELVKARTIFTLSLTLSNKLEKTYLDLLNTPTDPTKRKKTTRKSKPKSNQTKPKKND